MNEYRIAHISDIHLGPLPSVRLRDLMNKRLTGWLNWHLGRGSHFRIDVLEDLLSDLAEQKVDHIICSGDLCNLGLPQEWPQARAFMERLGQPDNVSFVPGNHDAYLEGSLEGFLQSLSDYIPQTEKAFPYMCIHGPFQFFFLNSAIPQPAFKARGTLGDIQIQQLKNLLDSCEQNPDLIKTIILHHPPLVHLGHPHKELTDAAELTEILHTYKINLVLFGHNHRHHVSQHVQQNHKSAIIGAPSLSLLSEREEKTPGYHIITAQQNNENSYDLSIESRLWSPTGIIGSEKNKLL